MTLLVLALSCIAYAVLSSAIVPALPSMQHKLHTSETGIAWLLTGYLLAASVGTSILGRLGDMYGKDRLLLWTMLILAGGTLIAALSSNLYVIIFARAIQGAGGGVFPLTMGIVRDEFPPERVPGSVGFLSSTLGIGGGAGIVLAGVIVAHLDYHWLFWLPLVLILIAAAAVWRFVPPSPVRVPGRINWLAALLMTIGISAMLLAVSETTAWGWGSVKTVGILAGGVVVTAIWVWVEARSREPLIDMTMMRVRAVWTTNAAAFLLGAGLYASFIIFPQFAQVPKRTGFGFGASVLVSGLYLLPATIGMTLLGMVAGRIARRFGSKFAFNVGAAFTVASFLMLALVHHHPYELLVAAALLGVGMGLAFAALGALIVQAVPSHQTGVASGMNTVLRYLGGALGGQLSATFIAEHTFHGLAKVTGYTESFLMATGFVAASLIAGILVPAARTAAAERSAGAGRRAAASSA
ncbi:MAG TPA: MFS transporter [Solirubrobacteraceae bacterium]|nr:MFS transporter [Solirubrobacteraceae bacterium]